MSRAHSKCRHLAIAMLATWALPELANAAPPGGGPLVGFGQSVLDFLSGVLGPIIFGIGLCMAAISLVMGSREGLHRAFYAIIGGALLFSVASIVEFVVRVAR